MKISRNINDLDDYNYKNQYKPESYKNPNLKEDDNEQPNILLDSAMDINALKQLQQSKMKSTDLNLDKELSQSKRNIKINEEKYFLKNRKWSYMDKNKKDEIEKKVTQISKEIKKDRYEHLVEEIKKCDLLYLYKNFNPREVIYKIGTLSTINYLIETTYYSQYNNIDMMFEDKKKIEPYISKFRNILGDGDCFYRGLIFYFLENIILTNNIMLMKELLVLYYEKINLKNPLFEKKEYLKNKEVLKNINIVTNILYYLIYLMTKNDTVFTYKTFLKVFLYCPAFDFQIIYFTRYILFEYILLNQNKIFSLDNQIEIGCLLPETFIEDKGEKNNYFFENYYSLQLMKPKTFAEKIVIYIAPFVFNCDINILIYEYGPNSFIQEKKFIGEKKSNFEINLIFRKSHYDIYYKKSYYEKYSEKLEILKNTKEDIIYLNAKNQKELQNKIKSEKKKNKENIENYEILFAEQTNNNNKDNLPKCLKCKNTYNHKENVFSICNNCLLNILESQILENYLSYIKNNMIYENIYEFLQKQKITISNFEDITLSQALNNCDYDLEDLFLKIRKSMCLYCKSNITNENFFIELPCNCRLCKKECFDKYFKIMVGKKLEIGIDSKNCEKGFNSLNCYCGFNYDLISLFYMIKKMEEKKLKKEKEIYQTFIKLYWKWKCMKCQCNFNFQMKCFRIIFKDDKIDKNLLLKKTDFYHLICYSCASYNRIDKIKEINCQFCKSKHTIIDFKVLNENNDVESECFII